MKRDVAVRIPVLAAVLGAALVAGACSSSDDIVIADFAGTWDATSYRVTSKADPAMAMDPILLGGTMTATVAADGAFTGSAVLPDPATMQPVAIPLAGNFILVDQESLTIDFVPDIPPFFTDETLAFRLSGDTLTLEDDDTGFDWDGDGIDDPSTLFAELRRR